MAIFHCQAKAISRAAGRTATAAAAYRAGEKIIDERTGEIHDYSRKDGVEYSEIFFPIGVNLSRSEIWNAAEFAEKRKDAKVAREWEIALPDELSENQQKELAREFGKALVERYGVAADVCIHRPGKEGDQRNHHAHILTTTRIVQADRTLGEKTRVLDSPKTSGQEVDAVRQLWANMANNALERAGRSERIDPRTLEDQGIDRLSTQHMGPTATAIERRGGEPRRTAHRADHGEPHPEPTQEMRVLDAVIGFTQGAQAEARSIMKEYKAEKARETQERAQAKRDIEAAAKKEALETAEKKAAEKAKAAQEQSNRKKEKVRDGGWER